MKKIARIIIIIMLVSLSLVYFGGCTDPFNDEDSGKQEVAGKTTVSVMVPGTDSAELSLMQSFKREFEKTNDKINIFIETFSGAYQNEMLSMISGKTLPDITWVGGNVHANFSSNGHYVDLTSYIARDNIDTSKFNATSMKTTHYNLDDEKIWYAPRDYNKVVTYVNVDMLAAAGITVPTVADFDYDKFYEICEQLRIKMDIDHNITAGLNGNSYPLQLGIGWDPIYKSILASSNATDYNVDKTVGLETTNAKLAYRRIGELYQRRFAVTPGTSDSDYFISAKTAFAFGVRPYLTSAEKSGFSYQVLPFPFERVGAGCSGYGITSVSNVKDEAWEFIKYIWSEAGQQVFGNSGIGVPVLESLWDNGTWRNYGNASLNHQAFVASPENDIDLNSINVYSPNTHLTILQNTAAIFQILKDNNTWVNSPLADKKNITKDKYKQAGNWSALDGKIKPYLDVIKAESIK